MVHGRCRGPEDHLSSGFEHVSAYLSANRREDSEAAFEFCDSQEVGCVRLELGRGEMDLGKGDEATGPVDGGPFGDVAFAVGTVRSWGEPCSLAFLANGCG